MGSIFKTYVYLAALNKGISINKTMFDTPIVGQEWSPKNFGNKSCQVNFGKSIVKYSPANNLVRAGGIISDHSSPALLIQSGTMRSNNTIKGLIKVA